MPRAIELVEGAEGTAAPAGTTAPVSRRPLILRLAAGAVLVGGLAAWGALVADVPALPLWWDVALAGFLLIPATLALAWLALPLRRWDGVAATGLALVGVALLCALAELSVLGNAAKGLAVILLALAFVNVFERPWWIGAVALAIPLVDAVSVWRGPTRHIVTERPGVFDLLSVAFPVPGGSFQLGLPDVLFFTIFLGAASRWHMRVAASWVLMTASFGGTMALAIWLDPFGLGGLPALPLLSLAFLVANGDLLVRSLRPPPAPPDPVRHLRVLPTPEPPAPLLTAGIAADGDGWVVAELEDGRLAWSHRCASLREALELVRDADAVGVEDVAGESRLEAMADRLWLGPAARRVYVDFLRELLAAPDDEEASDLCRTLGWDGTVGESLDFRRRAIDLRTHAVGPRVALVDVLPEAPLGTPAEAVRAVRAALGATDSPGRR